ncbi:Alpha/Beta hydrolase protein [Syncephalis fuscata]|nr:Alpha/Beta hydrolase protein [Syncephalis fuscata]
MSGTTKKLLIPSSVDQTLLDVCLTIPGNTDTRIGQPAVLITHPYGPLGGNSHNNVVQALRYHFVERGYVAVTLNFRGCGRSKGRTSWRGQSENEDLNTIVKIICSGQWPTENNSTQAIPLLFPPSRLLICGYSYGAMIAGAVDPDAVNNIPFTMVLISYPCSVTWFLTFGRSSYFYDALKQWLSRSPTPPILAVCGNQDQFTSTKSYQRWIQSLTETNADGITLRILPSVDHFWFGHENELLQLIQDWLDTITNE